MNFFNRTNNVSLPLVQGRQLDPQMNIWRTAPAAQNNTALMIFTRLWGGRHSAQISNESIKRLWGNRE